MYHRRILVWLTVFVSCATAYTWAQVTSQPAGKELRQRPADKPTTQRVSSKIKLLRDLEYAHVDGKLLRLNLRLPVESATPLPVIVYIHGGRWQRGGRGGCPLTHMAGRGYAVVSIDYRLVHEAIFPAQIHDCKAVIRWVRAHAEKYGLDPDRIGVWGNSAGGHLAALLGTSGGVKELEGDVGGNLEYSSRVQAVVDFCGPTSFLLQDLMGLQGAGRGKTPDAVVKLLGGTVKRKPESARLASPASFVSPDDPPFFITHGQRDTTVPVTQAYLLATALKKAGVETTLQIDPNASHGVGNPKIRRMAAAFLDKHLKAKTRATKRQN